MIAPFARSDSIGSGRFYLGDAIAVLSSLDAGCADALIMDPPYCSGGVTEREKGAARGQGLRSQSRKEKWSPWFQGDNMTTGGIAWLMRAVASEASRVVAPHGHLMAFCDWRMVTSLAPAMESAGWRLRNICVWDKIGIGLGCGFRPQHELIIHLTKRRPEFYSASGSNVLKTSRVGKGRRHPTAKPERLMRALVEVVSPPGGLVIDPFMGAGTTGVAALGMSRRFVGADIDPQFYQIALDRVTALCASGAAA